MGLLRKLQAANPDDQGGEGEANADMEVAPDSEPSLSQSSADEQDHTVASVEAGQQAGSQNAAVHPALLGLQALLVNHPWHYAESGDPDVLANGDIQWTIIESQIHIAMTAGHEAEVRQLWAQYAPPDYAFDDMLAGQPYLDRTTSSQVRLSDLPIRAASANDDTDAQQFPEPFLNFYSADQTGSGGPLSGGATASFDGNVYENEWTTGSGVARAYAKNFSEPYSDQNWPRGVVLPGANAIQPAQQDTPQNGTLLGKMLTLPFVVGSLALASLKKTAQAYYVRGRINGHDIMGRNVMEQAQAIHDLAGSLRAQGMEGLIQDMKMTGIPAKELFAGMYEGGAHQNFKDRLDQLMSSEQFAKQYHLLQEMVTDFSIKAERFAKSGVELNLEYSDILDRSFDRITKATEGFGFAKDGKLHHLQEMAKQLADKLAELINNLLGRFRPS